MTLIKQCTTTQPVTAAKLDQATLILWEALFLLSLLTPPLLFKGTEALQVEIPNFHEGKREKFNPAGSVET